MSHPRFPSNPDRPGRLRALALVPAIAAAASFALLHPAAAQTASSAPDEVHRDAPAARARGGVTAADVRFMSAMLAHHQDGLDMMDLALSRAQKSALRTLVLRMRSNFEDESAMMRAWLRDRDLVGDSEPAGPGAGVPPALGDRPGAPTPGQMEALRQATRTEFDDLFLRQAIRHHEGALQLADTLLATPEAARDEAISRILDGLQGEQSAYVGHMRRMLGDAWPWLHQD